MPSECIVVVLWEDSLAVGTNPTQFGPHMLLLASVADALVAIEPAWEARWYSRFEALRVQIGARPRRGVNKLIAGLDDPSLYGKGRNVFAVIDGDVSIELPPTQASVHVLERNLEDLVRHLMKCGGRITGEELATVERKSRNALAVRDKVLTRHSHTNMRAVREILCTSADGWTGWPGLVQRIAELLRSRWS